MSGASLGRFPSPLRYPGGKGKIANYVKLIMLENNLVGVDYVEPYAGGASVALSLLFEDYADHIHINDLNHGVHAFWDAVLNNTNELCELILTTEVTVDEWQRQREIQNTPETATPLELGFSTFFLNRTNRSGIISGGIIGGVEQTGPWKIDARFNKSALIQRIRKVSRFRSRISLTRHDALDFLDTWTKASTSPAFLYLDPPYYVKGEGLYDNFYNAADHAAIAEKVTTLIHPWIVSYDAAPAILPLYTTGTSLSYGLSYSAAGSSTGAEVMFYSPGLVVPAEDTPSGIRTGRLQHERLRLLTPNLR